MLKPALICLVAIAGSAVGAGAVEFKGFDPDKQQIVETAIDEVARNYVALSKARTAFDGILDMDAYGAAIEGVPFRSEALGSEITLVYAGNQQCGSGVAAQVRHDQTNATHAVATVKVCPTFFEMLPDVQVETLAHELYHVVEGTDECFARYTQFWIRATNAKPFYFDGGDWLDYECDHVTPYLPPAELRATSPKFTAAVDLVGHASAMESDKWTVGDGWIGVASEDGGAYFGLACTATRKVAVYGLRRIDKVTLLNEAELVVARDVPASASVEGRISGKIDNAYVNGLAGGPATIVLYGAAAEGLAEDVAGADKSLTLRARSMSDSALTFGRHVFTAKGSSAAARYLLGGCKT